MRMPFSLRVVPSPVSYCFVDTAEEAVVSVAVAEDAVVTACAAVVTAPDAVVLSAAAVFSAAEDAAGADSAVASVCTSAAETALSVPVTFTEVCVLTDVSAVSTVVLSEAVTAEVSAAVAASVVCCKSSVSVTIGSIPHPDRSIEKAAANNTPRRKFRLFMH